eukprot:CAMPEP_0174383362 /NCGR_PEP_ID=MMETSP0811_2-20130205/125182_1 /TAXON_ID=73025 ORGANISM="Eutreptiella gymnastica-like, Strain CCMP1594" /NCGR_SAMPLE_ID=MMETSP0811_2 /ASSEMBLY_ACC=CAM_ASM_000667 /LENGTH=72 /DNA_ID=CAMNT_0015536915 /DNA_START=504 /DNA_END=722 /DNA_ORIENTATION=+
MKVFLLVMNTTKYTCAIFCGRVGKGKGPDLFTLLAAGFMQMMRRPRGPLQHGNVALQQLTTALLMPSCVVVA